MSTVNLVESFGEFKDIKNIDRVTMMGILEDVFRGVIKKRSGKKPRWTSSSTPTRAIWRSGSTA
jgi:N utilization substance protein A